MRSLNDYLEAAKKNTGVKSYRQLGVHLGLNPSIVTQYRTRRAWPSDEAMYRIAEAAGIDPHEALLELAYWRCTHRKETHAAKAFKDLIERNLHAAIVGAVMAGSLLISNGKAEASPLASNCAQPERVYIMEYYFMI